MDRFWSVFNQTTRGCKKQGNPGEQTAAAIGRKWIAAAGLQVPRSHGGPVRGLRFSSLWPGMGLESRIGSGQELLPAPRGSGEGGEKGNG